MAYGSGFANNLPAWKPLAVQTPPVVPSTAAPGPITSYNANQLRVLQHGEPAPMPPGGAARPPISQQVSINNSVGQITPRSGSLGGATSPAPSSLERFESFVRPNTAFRTQGTVGANSFADVFPPGPQPVEYPEAIGPRAPYAEPVGPRVPYAEPIGPHNAYKIGAGPYSVDEPFLYEKPVGPAYQSRAMRDLKSIGGVLGKVGNAASYVVNNPVTNNPLTRLGAKVAAPVGIVAGGASALTDKSGYQDPIEKYFGWGNLHDRVDAANADYYAHVNAGDQVGGLKSVLKSALPVAGHALYSAAGRPIAEATEWALNKLNPVSSAAAQPTATPPGSPPPAAPPPAAPPPAATPPAAQPGMPHTVTVGPQNQSLTDRYPDRFKHVPGFGQVLNGGANSGRTPLSPQEQAYNAEVMRGLQLENRSRELANVDRYRATQLHDRNALATLAATHGGHPLGHQLEREQQDPESKGDALRQQMSLIDERRNAVTNALFDQNNADAASKIMNARQAHKSYSDVLRALGLTAPTFEEMMQSDYGRTYNPKTGYFATPK